MVEILRKIQETLKKLNDTNKPRYGSDVVDAELQELTALIDGIDKKATS